VRLTQGCFSFLPDLTDTQIEKQVAYAMSKGWAMNVEWTDDPHPRNQYWELWGLPLFDIKDPAAAEAVKRNDTVIPLVGLTMY
jgi:ribulose-bisphosphate carboxylase small chain